VQDDVWICVDRCGSSAYCPVGSTCQVRSDDMSGVCLPTNILQNRVLGDDCSDSGGSAACASGTGSCTQISPGNAICTDVCCRASDCGPGYFCSFNGNQSPSVYQGYDTAPVCWPQSGTHDRPPGAQCTANDQCESGFCDANLETCMAPCCHDTACPGGQFCQRAAVFLGGANTTTTRICLDQTPADPLEPM
jgi:hypothetical protein